MRLLDLFCGAGGAAMGYHRAGFEVVGVDNRPQPRYPFEFQQADALRLLEAWSPPGSGLLAFDAIHASPPCQAFTAAQPLHGYDHPDLLTPTRQLLNRTGLPWVIENVPGAPMRPDFVLCGSQFGLAIRRHRWFETSWHGFALALSCDHSQKTFSVVGHGGGQGPGARWSKAEGAAALGIDWMGRDELAQAIPPAYTELIGHQLMTHLKAVAA